ILILFGTKYLLSYFAPFILAILIAALIDPFVNLLENNLKCPRGIAVSVVLLLFLAVVILLLTLVVTNLTAELTHLVSLLPRYRRYWDELLGSIIEWAKNWYILLFHDTPAPILEMVRPDFDQVADTIRMLASHFLSAIGGLPSFLFTLIIASIATFFISRDRRVFARSLMDLIPKRWRPEAEEIKEQVGNGIFGYFRSQLMLISLSGSIAVIGLTILKIRYAWLLGLLVAILDFIPMTGPGGVFVPLTIYHLFIGDFRHAIWLTAIQGVTLVTRQLAEPRIMGAQLGLHPLTSLVAIYLGAQFLGFSGFILGPIVMVILKAVMVAIFIPAWTKE
ncbi:MAG: sporulation integral membrane protein YtvI, partial [Firmicutes bacterium]|nr:sporulation integral membrane protein YtvI [Bacillota bacterium]